MNSATNKVAHTEPRIVEVRNRFAELVCALPKVLYKHLSYEDDTGKVSLEELGIIEEGVIEQWGLLLYTSGVLFHVG